MAAPARSRGQSRPPTPTLESNRRGKRHFVHLSTTRSNHYSTRRVQPFCCACDDSQTPAEMHGGVEISPISSASSASEAPLAQKVRLNGPRHPLHLGLLLRYLSKQSEQRVLLFQKPLPQHRRQRIIMLIQVIHLQG